MGLALKLEEFASRAIRKSATGNDGGIRRIAKSALTDATDNKGGLIGKLWDGFARFSGSLLGNIWNVLASTVKFTLTGLYSVCVSSFQFLWNFNWNASDADLDASIKNAFTSLGGTLGGTVGNALGWITCGAVPGAVIAAFNEPMGLYVLEKVGEEALEEIAGNVANLIKQTATSLARASGAFLYKNIRTLWRKSDGNFVADLIKQGMPADKAKDALEKRNKPWSIAKKVEDWVDSWPDGFWKSFTEELLEEFGESCIEAGYVVVNNVESYLAQQKVANDSLLGKEETVEITLNRQADGTLSTQ